MRGGMAVIPSCLAVRPWAWAAADQLHVHRRAMTRTARHFQDHHAEAALQVPAPEKVGAVAVAAAPMHHREVGQETAELRLPGCSGADALPAMMGLRDLRKTPVALAAFHCSAAAQVAGLGIAPSAPGRTHSPPPSWRVEATVRDAVGSPPAAMAVWQAARVAVLVLARLHGVPHQLLRIARRLAEVRFRLLPFPAPSQPLPLPCDRIPHQPPLRLPARRVVECDEEPPPWPPHLHRPRRRSR